MTSHPCFVNLNATMQVLTMRPFSRGWAFPTIKDVINLREITVVDKLSLNETRISSILPFPLHWAFNELKRSVSLWNGSKQRQRTRQNFYLGPNIPFSGAWKAHRLLKNRMDHRIFPWRFNLFIWGPCDSCTTKWSFEVQGKITMSSAWV